MTQPINPNTTLPMSLRVDRLQQLKQVQPEHQQGHLTQEMDNKNRTRQKRVNENNETEEGKIRDDDARKQQQEEERKNREESEEKEKLDAEDGQKGFYIDIKI